MHLYNTQGLLVKQWPAVTLDKGEHTVPLQLNGVAAGSYVLMVTAGETKQTIQLVKLSTH